ncbi:MAG: bifunctional methylenetetrahydrofolate dehydrogenase/methenyltetrahydrofolate cyclohydrolase, partial [Rhodoferax sp.]|nr:bifunctional methylenetetrahydrofolate dehydrogenase/methenyltetrahydrofolate cyclohydrolase [Rhodoferax sp.]MCB2039750.1 bifunctional methylenetetrahydrofolate dehydrogenase/methenyltetrahydrofolate cyclohydrolase [Rhodoferax sp.]
MTERPSARIIDGVAISRQLRADVAARAGELTRKGVRPGLAVILVGEDPASQV